MNLDRKPCHAMKSSFAFLGDPEDGSHARQGSRADVSRFSWHVNRLWSQWLLFPAPWLSLLMDPPVVLWCFMPCDYRFRRSSKKGFCSLEKVKHSLAGSFWGNNQHIPAPTFEAVQKHNYLQARQHKTQKDWTVASRFVFWPKLPSQQGLKHLWFRMLPVFWFHSIKSHNIDALQAGVHIEVLDHCIMINDCFLFYFSSHVCFVILQNCCRPPRWWVSFSPTCCASTGTTGKQILGFIIAYVNISGGISGPEL